MVPYGGLMSGSPCTVRPPPPPSAAGAAPRPAAAGAGAGAGGGHRVRAGVLAGPAHDANGLARRAEHVVHVRASSGGGGTRPIGVSDELDAYA